MLSWSKRGAAGGTGLSEPLIRVIVLMSLIFFLWRDGYHAELVAAWCGGGIGVV